MKAVCILGSLGFSPQKPEERAIERDEDGVRSWKRSTWPALKKSQREGRLIVFVDESGISERPTCVRTWTPKGQTPITQFHFNWNYVSVIAGLTRTNRLFRCTRAVSRRKRSSNSSGRSRPT